MPVRTYGDSRFRSDQDDWTNFNRGTSMRRARLVVFNCSVFYRHGSSLMTVAHRVGPLLVPIAPPGSLRRRALRFGYRGLKMLPRLLDSRYRSTTLLGSLAFPIVDRPLVSVIVPVCDQFGKTLQCLESLNASTVEASFEVIVVDDRSGDRASPLLRRVPGLVALRNDRRIGLKPSCDRGAAAARGEYLVFLDQDARVTPGWLDALVQTFRESPGTGMAGAKLVLPDARLLEAGAAVWRDGSTCSYGQFDDAGHPLYNFAREVDYCSGGCLMVPRALFLELGGFDAAAESVGCDSDRPGISDPPFRP